MKRRTIRSVLSILFVCAMIVCCVNAVLAVDTAQNYSRVISSDLTEKEIYDATHAELALCRGNLGYTALGDLSAMAGYADKTAAALGISGSSYKNFAAESQTVADTLTVISKNKSTIANSLIVSLGYSSNKFLDEAVHQIDLMLMGDPATSYDWVGLLGKEDASKVKDYLASLHESFAADGYNTDVMGMNLADMLTAALEGYSYKLAEHLIGLPAVIDAVRSANPNALIVLVGMYNGLDNIVLKTEGGSDFAIGQYMQLLVDAGNDSYLTIAARRENTVYIANSDVQTISEANGTASSHDIVSFVWDLLFNGTGNYYPSAKGNESIKGNIVSAIKLTAHIYNEVVTAPTCSAEGYTTYTCKVCGHSYVGNKVAAKDHSYAAVVTEPTCTEKGYTTYTCKVCGYSYVGNNVAAKDHSYAAVVTEPTCTEKGYTTYTCKVCGYSYVGNNVAVKDHSYAAVVTEPTCTEKGYTTYTCRLCRHNYVGNEVAAKDHSYKTAVTAPTCTAGGYTTYTCKVCSHSYVGNKVDAKGHSYIESVKAPTCTEKGYTTFSCKNCTYSYADKYVPATGHSYKKSVTAPTCTEVGYTYYVCSCGDDYISDRTNATGHSFGDWKVTKEATEHSEGARERACSACGTVEKAVIPVLSHTHKYTSYTVAPTCTENGYTVYTCDCTAVYVDNYVDATGHSYNKTVTASTCTDKGYTTYKCTRCTDSHIGDHTDALGHDYRTTVKAATCTDRGYTTYKCTRCTDNHTGDYTDALGHDYSTTVTAPTCMDRGYTTYKCTRCTESHVDDYVSAKGHTFGEWKVVTAPDCTSKGVKKQSCDCGYAETGEVSALGHDFEVNYTVDVKPTIEAPGRKSRHCTRCDDVTDVTEMPSLTDTSKVFKDVKSKSWFRSAVDYVVSNGLMNGMTADTFEPNTTMSRAMLVTVLWRLEGSPETDIKAPFTDLKQAWYKGAVAWAYKNGIVTGTSDTKFSPNGNITREQMAAILYRYSDYKGYDSDGRADLSAYPDANKVSKYAKDAFAWANAEGLITGTTGDGGSVMLAPRASATRAQVATILTRFCEDK